MIPDNGPPDGDFARYVETLGRARSITPDPSRAPHMGQTPQTVAQGRLDAATTANLATLRAEFAPLLRMSIIVLLLLGIAGAFGPPYSTMARIAALVLAVFVIRRGMSRAAQIRSAMRATMESAQARMNEARTEVEKHKR